MSSMSRKIAAIAAVGGVVLGSLALAPSAVGAPPVGSPSESAGDAGAVAAYWTPERRAAAIPRDLVIDENGPGATSSDPTALLSPMATLLHRGHRNPCPRSRWLPHYPPQTSFGLRRRQAGRQH